MYLILIKIFIYVIVKFEEKMFTGYLEKNPEKARSKKLKR